MLLLRLSTHRLAYLFAPNILMKEELVWDLSLCLRWLPDSGIGNKRHPTPHH